MSLGLALQNALSGLTASSRSVEVVSSNVANAMTEGYARRDLELAPVAISGGGNGVKVVGVTRHLNQQIVNDNRLAMAEVGRDSTRQEFLSTMSSTLGIPGDPASLSGRIDRLEAALVEASASPQSQARLGFVVSSAQQVADHLNATSKKIQDLRMQADREIGVEVDRLNDTLQKVVKLNLDIKNTVSTGGSAAGLMDQRQILVNQIAEIIPLKEKQHDDGSISLYSPSGTILLESSAVKIGFSPTGYITSDMTLAAGSLSGLTVNGLAVPTNSTRSTIGGGRLAALFEVRDELATTAQSEMDAIARDLVERFQSPTVDPTLGATDPGLFTDKQSFFDPLNEDGLAERIKVNNLVVPEQGGLPWKLRTGLNAVAQGDLGDATLINNYLDALKTRRQPASGSFATTEQTASVLAGNYVSKINTKFTSTEVELSFSSARQNSLNAMILENGVDTDQEMQKLLLIEQSYSANARVLTTLDEMINTILRL